MLCAVRVSLVMLRSMCCVLCGVYVCVFCLLRRVSCVACRVHRASRLVTYDLCLVSNVLCRVSCGRGPCVSCLVQCVLCLVSCLLALVSCLVSLVACPLSVVRLVLCALRLAPCALCH